MECRTLCPASMEATAHCGRCDINLTSHICTVVRGPHSSTEKVTKEEMCSSDEETVHTASVNTYSFTGNRKRAVCPGLLGRGHRDRVAAEMYLLYSLLSLLSKGPSYFCPNGLQGSSNNNLSILESSPLKFFEI